MASRCVLNLRCPEQAQDQGSKDQKEETQEQRINACFPRHLTVRSDIFAFQQLQIDGKNLERVDDRQQRCECADKQ